MLIKLANKKVSGNMPLIHYIDLFGVTYEKCKEEELTISKIHIV